MSKFSFNEKKATQLAAAFIERSGRELNYMKLIKLMYMSDRAALLGWERPITGDAYVSMKHGPVLSDTYSMISDGQHPSENGFWFEYIERSGKYDVALSQPCPPNNLSTAELRVIDEVFEKYGHYDQWALVNHLHNILPEWKHPGCGANPIYIRDILQSGGISGEQAERVEAELEDLKAVRALLS